MDRTFFDVHMHAMDLSHPNPRAFVGRDYMINLMWSNSYNEYLDLFIKTSHIGNKQKVLFCNVNPTRFLFL